MILGFQMLLQAVVLDMQEKPDMPVSDVFDLADSEPAGRPLAGEKSEPPVA